MRIIAGILRGRNFESPHSHKTHPMSEKMRGAMFNVLGEINEMTVLDAYGGSGALAFEAISRGASSALIIEVEKHAASTIETNIAVLGLKDTVKLVRANAASWSERNFTTQFDLVLCDPPYDAIKQNHIIQLVNNVKKGGLLVLSAPSFNKIFELEGMEIALDKRYGDASLVFYRKI